MLNAQPPCENWYQLTMRVTSFARENRRRVYHLYQSSQRDLLENEYYQVVFGAVEKLVRRTRWDRRCPGGFIRSGRPSDRGNGRKTDGYTAGWALKNGKNWCRI